VQTAPCGSHLSPASSSYTRERAYHSHRPAVLPHYRMDRDSLTALPPRSITRVDDRQQRWRYPTYHHADKRFYCHARQLVAQKTADDAYCCMELLLNARFAGRNDQVCAARSTTRVRRSDFCVENRAISIPSLQRCIGTVNPFAQRTHHYISWRISQSRSTCLDSAVFHGPWCISHRQPDLV